MVVTQLQLKWPNHSTHLLTGLKSLFRNEQLVDCTLKCNKHTLKVHRSVLAACSPYFERELENSPSIVIRDMQFNVLQALIEFMYYGETQISEENFTSLLEAAKLFEVKGLSEMDLLTSTGNANIISPVISTSETEGKNYSAADDIIFEGDTQPKKSSVCQQFSGLIDVMPNGGENSSMIDERLNGEDSNCSLAVETVNVDLSQAHSCRNFVVTPPQTESAQILLALARSCNEKQLYFHSAESPSSTASNCNSAPLAAPATSTVVYSSVAVPEAINDHDYDRELDVNKEEIIALSSSECSSGVVSELPVSVSSPEAVAGQQLVIATNNTPLTNAVTAAAAVYSTSSTSVVTAAASSSVVDLDDSACENKSLLARLLTRNSQMAQCKIGDMLNQYDENYECLYQSSTQTPPKSENNCQIVENGSSAKNTFDLQSDILGCPFLIETNDGYVDMAVDNMLNVFDNAEVFDPCSSVCKTTALKIVSPEVSDGANGDEFTRCNNNGGGGSGSGSGNGSTRVKIETLNDDVLERIKQEEDEDDLKNDPGAVVLRRINEDGLLEKYVLSSTDISILKTMIEEKKGRTSANSVSTAMATSNTAVTTRTKTPSPPATKAMVTVAPHIEVELPSSCGSASLITRIICAEKKVENVISKLPFKKSGSCWKFEKPVRNYNSSCCVHGEEKGGADGRSSATSRSSCSSISGNTTTVTSSSAKIDVTNTGIGSVREYISSSDGNRERILDGASLTVDQPHHHENMFEELDSQFSMVDCSMENIQREYVAYEEASKNETQLDHNYYANAMKDEDEECVAISDNYSLDSIMLIEKSMENESCPRLSSLANPADKCIDDTSSSLSLPENAVDDIRVAEDADNGDIYLNGGTSGKDDDDKPPVTITGGVISATGRRNGIATKVVSLSVSAMPVSSISVPMFNQECDLIMNKDAVMNSVLNSTISTVTLSSSAIANTTGFTTTISTSTTTTIHSRCNSNSPLFLDTTATVSPISISALTTHTSTKAVCSTDVSATPKTKALIVNGSFSTFKTLGRHLDAKRKYQNSSAADHGTNMLPFKKVKKNSIQAVADSVIPTAVNTNIALGRAAAKKGRQTCRRRRSSSSTDSNSNSSSSSSISSLVKVSNESSNSNARSANIKSVGTNGGMFYEHNITNNLVEEIIVDEIS